MKRLQYLILGAGPAGLSFACRLLQNGVKDFLVLEKETEAGGLCRSMEVDGSPLDIGGGHFLDVRRPAVDEFLFGFMPREEWERYERDSRIFFDGGYIGHPFEAHIWQMKPEKQREYLASIQEAGCNQGKEMPSDFVDWIYWKLGDKIAEDYMLPYNEKMFGSELNELGTYWLEKLPNVSYEETRRSCEEKRAYGKQPGHAQFYYPKKYGYGEVWLRMQRALGEKLVTGCPAVSIDFTRKAVTAGDGTVYEAENIITTVPWTDFKELSGMPEDLRRELSGELKYSSVQIEYFPENMDTDAQWIYYPQREISFHRILVRHNFCPGSRGYWTETNSSRTEPDSGHFRFMNRYAYPLNTLKKPGLMRRLLNWAADRDVYGLGRWGEHEHYNSDLVVEKALALADRMTGKR